MKSFNMNVEITDQINGQIALNTNFGINVNEMSKNTMNMAPNEVFDVFSGVLTLAHDITTNYSISNPSANTYRFNFVSGTDPVFRTKRSHVGDNTTNLTITKSNNTAIIEHKAGTAFNFVTGGFIVGDSIQIRGNEFDTVNQGVFKVLIVEEAKIIYENVDAISETVTLLQNLDINGFSEAGIKVGSGLSINSTFSSSAQGSYSITAVTNEYIEFFSANTIPSEGPLAYVANMITISLGIKKLLYIVADEQTEVTIDSVVHVINKLVGTDGTVYKAQMLLTGEFSSIQVKNTSINGSIVEVVVAG